MTENSAIPTNEKIKNLYNRIFSQMEPEDRWHQYSTSQIRAAVETCMFLASRSDARILNAGSGDIDYFGGDLRPFNADISLKALLRKQRALLADIQNLPLESERLDLVICVGSVLNCLDAAPAIAEMARVLKPGGYLLLEFERTRSAQNLFRPAYLMTLVPVLSFYKNHAHPLWLYSDSYIQGLLEQFHIAVVSKHYFHIATGMLVRCGVPPPIAARYAFLDFVFRKLRCLARLGGNAVWMCQHRPHVDGGLARQRA